MTKRKKQHNYNKSTTQRDKSEGTVERKKTKRYRDRNKQHRQNSTFQNNERKFYLQEEESVKTVLYVSRKERGRRITSMEDSVGKSIQRLKDNVLKRGGKVITVIKKTIRQHNYQQNRNKKKNKKWEGKNPWTLQTIKKRNLIRENMHMAKKGKP